MKYYKKLDITVKSNKLIFEEKEVDNYIDIINNYASYGWTLNQILALPSEDNTSLITLQIILETENENLFQGYSY